MQERIEAMEREIQEIWHHLGRIWYPDQDGELARGWDVALGVAASLALRAGRADGRPGVREAMDALARQLRGMRTTEGG
ncbi:hypothetical protein [Deferrisoma camini]|uniref:hypothetical protein n=1 Tax=Deferrisoma camini TaxID=1035120 RepID=UPI00046D85E8|nr:hypothetical protein [Deferrisoma camini]